MFSLTSAERLHRHLNVDVSNHNHPLFSKLFLYHLQFFILSSCEEFYSFQSEWESFYYRSGFCFITSIFVIPSPHFLPLITMASFFPSILMLDTSTRRTVWCYAQADFDLACELLDHTDWNSLCTEAHAGCQPTLVSVAVQVLQCYGAMYTSESPPYSKASSLA